MTEQDDPYTRRQTLERMMQSAQAKADEIGRFLDLSDEDIERALEGKRQHSADVPARRAGMEWGDPESPERWL